MLHLEKGRQPSLKENRPASPSTLGPHEPCHSGSTANLARDRLGRALHLFNRPAVKMFFVRIPSWLTSRVLERTPPSVLCWDLIPTDAGLWRMDETNYSNGIGDFIRGEKMRVNGSMREPKGGALDFRWDRVTTIRTRMKVFRTVRLMIRFRFRTFRQLVTLSQRRARAPDQLDSR